MFANTAFTYLNIHPVDVVDIALVSLFVYFALRLIRGTRAEQMLVGLLVLVVVYALARYFSLLTLEWLFSQFFSFFIVIMVVLFQHEIRRGLMQVAFNPLSLSSSSSVEKMIDDLADSAVALTHRHWGALFVIERDTGLNHLIEPAMQLDIPLCPDTALTVFCPKAPLHDGAVVVRQTADGGCMVAARVLLPLTQSHTLPGDYGTRHRAAVGLVEESDALVIVVSEERGQIHIANQDGLSEALDRRTLVALLLQELRPSVSRWKS
ncbi:MAG: diadenylate cyclase [Mariprofundaceae bacterium]|nr:diadenylate cyclase [Mariprofundaceae bacterium]